MLNKVEVRCEAVSANGPGGPSQHRAVWHTRTRLAIDREPRSVLAEPIGGVIEYAGKAMLNVVVRSGQDFLFRIVEGSVYIIGEGNRRGHRVHILGVCPGVAHSDVPAIVIGLEQAEGQRLGFVAL